MAGDRKSAGSGKKLATGRRRKRAKITDAVRENVIAALKAGKTGAAVAKEAGISLPSVENIKKAAGLVKGRSKASK